MCFWCAAAAIRCHSSELRMPSELPLQFISLRTLLLLSVTFEIFYRFATLTSNPACWQSMLFLQIRIFLFSQSLRAYFSVQVVLMKKPSHLLHRTELDRFKQGSFARVLRKLTKSICIWRLFILFVNLYYSSKENRIIALLETIVCCQIFQHSCRNNISIYDFSNIATILFLSGFNWSSL